MKLRFGLKTLLIGMLVCSVLIWWYTQRGMGIGHFNIEYNAVVVDGDYVSGELGYRMAVVVETGTRYDYFVLVINPIELDGIEKTESSSKPGQKEPKLLSVQKGDKFKLKHRVRDTWPISRTDPHREFIARTLGINRDYVLGWAYVDDHTEIAIGRRKEK